MLEPGCGKLFLRNSDCINSAAKGQYENRGRNAITILTIRKTFFPCLSSVSYYAVE